VTRRGYARLHVETLDEWRPRLAEEVIVIEGGVFHYYRVDYDEWDAFTAWAAGAFCRHYPEQADRILHLCAAAEYPWLDLDDDFTQEEP